MSNPERHSDRNPEKPQHPQAAAELQPGHQRDEPSGHPDHRDGPRVLCAVHNPRAASAAHRAGPGTSRGLRDVPQAALSFSGRFGDRVDILPACLLYQLHLLLHSWREIQEGVQQQGFSVPFVEGGEDGYKSIHR